MRIDIRISAGKRPASNRAFWKTIEAWDEKLSTSVYHQEILAERLDRVERWVLLQAPDLYLPQAPAWEAK